MFSAGLLIFLINSYSVNSCNFGVPLGGGELRVFPPFWPHRGMLEFESATFGLLSIISHNIWYILDIQ